MIRITPRRQLLDRMRTVVSDPGSLATAQSGTQDPPDAVVQWLGNLMALNGVPFNYLVADEGILPSESIRFFQVDPNWIYALVEGATSLGRSSSTMQAHDAVHAAALHATGARAARALRTPAVQPETTPAPLTGFLLRSAVVSGWPGLEIAAYDAQNNLLPLFRMDRLSPTILLYMVTGALALVNIYEPPEGLHFGVELTGGKQPRYVTVPAGTTGVVPGDEIPDTPAQKISSRGPGVIKINQLANGLCGALAAKNANNDPNTGAARPFTSAEFAVQMVEGTQSVVFVNAAPPAQQANTAPPAQKSV